jgi:hypothetical protein
VLDIISFSGELIGDTLNSMITIFIGNSGEYSEAIRNQNGYKDLMIIKEIVNKYVMRN